MFKRLLKLNVNNNLLLFGPRGCGKSTYLRELFASIPKEKIAWFDLLLPEIEEKFLSHPSRLKEEVLAQKPEVVVIDEVQKVPKLLDVVHHLTESRDIRARFILTGSSARKLKRQGVNLLAGRAFVYELDPLCEKELGDAFSLQEALEFGLLPKIYVPDLGDQNKTWGTEEKKLYLKAYARTYLREEIQIEQEVRNVDAFRDFLDIAAQMNGQPLNFAKIGKDVNADSKTVRTYFQILEDTLLGFFLPSFHRSVRRRQRAAPKFYLFDTGVRRALGKMLDESLSPRSFEYGEAFEHFVLLELRKRDRLLQRESRFSYLRTKDGAEIDVIIERGKDRPILCEIKSTDHVSDETVRSLLAFKDDFRKPQLVILSREKCPREVDGVRILPWNIGIDELMAWGQTGLVA